MGNHEALSLENCTKAGMFPIVEAQKHRGNLSTDGARRVAILHDLSYCTHSSDARRTMTMPGHEDIAPSLAQLLALAFASDEAFAQVFPDKAMSTPTISGSTLPGFRAADDGGWEKVPPEQATPQQQRNYIRNHLMVNAAKHVMSMLSREKLDEVALHQPASLPGLHYLSLVATDVCNKFDPEYARGLNPRHWDFASNDAYAS